ncbi:MAG: ATP-binding protein, partial [Tannerellaceae bacterium]|nr:ATP-binding protein [Tannerellaceae bacterium]
IELKLWRGEKSLEGGVEQTLRYMDVYGATEGWLALFDRGKTSWDEKIYMERRTIDGKAVTIVGL